jgi:hypothetical protein
MLSILIITIVAAYAIDIGLRSNAYAIDSLFLFELGADATGFFYFYIFI